MQHLKQRIRWRAEVVITDRSGAVKERKKERKKGKKKERKEKRKKERKEERKEKKKEKERKEARKKERKNERSSVLYGTPAGKIDRRRELLSPNRTADRLSIADNLSCSMGHCEQMQLSELRHWCADMPRAVKKTVSVTAAFNCCCPFLCCQWWHFCVLGFYLMESAARYRWQRNADHLPTLDIFVDGKHHV